MTKYYADVARQINKKYRNALSKFEQDRMPSYVLAVFEVITAMLKENDAVYISEFGRFSLAEQKDLKVKHPVTREDVFIPAHYIPKFAPAIKLKELMATIPLDKE